MEAVGKRRAFAGQTEVEPSDVPRIEKEPFRESRGKSVWRLCTVRSLVKLDVTMHMHYLSTVLARCAAQESVMTALAQEVSKLTDRYQTTVPTGVRRQLKLRKGDQIRYCTEPSGRVYIEPLRDTNSDPALGAFLDFIEADIKAHPERLKAFDGALLERLKALVGDVEVDLDAALSPDDE